MRIAIVGGSEQIVGGAETYLRWLLPSLEQCGHAVGFGFEQAASAPERAVQMGVALEGRWHLAALGRSGFSDAIAAFRPDLLYLHGLRDSECEAALLARFPAVVFAHAYWGTCITGIRAHTRPRRELCARRFGPACLALNYARGCGARNPLVTLRAYRSQQRRARALGTPEALVVASEHMRATYERQGVDADRIHVIPYPPPDISPDAEPPPPRPPRDNVLYLGRLTSLKGVDHAVQAVDIASAMLGRTLSLTIAGDGPELEHLREMARAEPRLRVLGWVDGGKRVELMRDADALIVPSLWPEPFGMVGIEAGCVGVPSVAYEVGGIPDWLEPGKSGELARPFDVRELALALTRALRDPSHHQALRVGAWRRAADFAPTRHLTLLTELFASIVNPP